jgi:GrpB-like predicted nucleotidyltransferase (UPF0157 family)
VTDDTNAEGEAGTARSLAGRLAAAGARNVADPVEAWRLLRAAEGPRATVVDLYGIVAAPRGLAAHELPIDERLRLARAAMPDMWPGFSTTTGNERSDPLVVADYDPRWPAAYGRWRARIAPALGPVALGIEHIGSTSVPGLAAKPIIDILVMVADLDREAGYDPPLERGGLVLRSRDELHRYFRPPAGQPREVHVHVCPAGSRWEREHLLFRDYLRGHPAACRAYGDAKRANARIWAGDGWGYTDAKTNVVLDIMADAESWALATGWAAPRYRSPGAEERPAR